MAVTFESKPSDYRPYEYEAQLPIEDIFKGLAYKQGQFDQNAAAIQKRANDLKIDAIGHEAEIRDKIINQVNQEMSNFAGADFTDASVVNQFNSFLSQVASGPELAAISQHSSALRKMEKDRQAAAAKGKTWLNQGLNDAYEYYQKGKFDPTVRFIDQGFEMPDLTKETDALAKACPDYESYKNWSPDSRYYVKQKENSINCLSTTFYNSIADPNTPLGKYYNYEFNQKFGKNAEEVANQFLEGKEDDLYQVLDYLPKDKQVEAAKKIGELKILRAANDPRTKGEVQSYFKNNYFKNAAYEHANLKHVLSETDLKINDFKKMAQEQADKFAQIDYQAWVDSGKPTDEAGNPVIYPKESRDQLVPAKYSYKEKDPTSGTEVTKTVSLDPIVENYYKITAGKSPETVAEDNVDLGKYSFFGSTDKTNTLGSGWKQLTTDAIIDPLLEKAPFKDPAGNMVYGKNIAYRNGYPAVFVKGDQIVYGVPASRGALPTSAGDMELIVIPNADTYFSKLSTTPKYQSLNASQSLKDAKAAGNIFTKGASSFTKGETQVTTIKPKTGYTAVQVPGYEPYQIKTDSVSSFLRKNPNAKVLSTTK